MIKESLDEARERMEGAIEALRGDLAGIRTGWSSHSAEPTRHHLCS
jgi:ribosome recycling factor